MATACYIPRYIPASYKGVPFEALEATSEHGRRGAEGEFPFGETTAYADLGRMIRRYTISGRLAENNHVAMAAAIIAAVETPGPGVLLHPTRGAVIVACTNLHVRDGIEEEAGVTYLDFDFVEGNDWANGFNFGAAVLGGISLAAIIAATRDNFAEDYNPNRVRWYQVNDVVASGVDALRQISTQFQSAAAVAPTDKDWRTIADFNAIINDPYMMRDPDVLSTATVNGMGLLDARATRQRKYTQFRTLANWGAKVSTLTDEAAIAQNSVYGMMRVLGAAYMVRAVTEAESTTLDAAMVQYDTISNILNEEAAVANSQCASPKYFLALRDFIIEAQKTLLHNAYNLPSLVTYHFPGPTHSLLAAHEIFGDAKRSREIESRNPQYLPWAAGPSIVASRLNQ